MRSSKHNERHRKIISLAIAVSFILVDISYAGTYQECSLRVPIGAGPTLKRVEREMERQGGAQAPAAAPTQLRATQVQLPIAFQPITFKLWSALLEGKEARGFEILTDGERQEAAKWLAAWGGEVPIESDQNALIAYTQSQGRLIPIGVQSISTDSRLNTVFDEGLFVDADRRGQHVASAIREALIKALAQRGYNLFVTAVGISDEAQKFHRSWADSLGKSAEVEYDNAQRGGKIKKVTVDLRKIAVPAQEQEGDFDEHGVAKNERGRQRAIETASQVLANLLEEIATMQMPAGIASIDEVYLVGSWAEGKARIGIYSIELRDRYDWLTDQEGDAKDYGTDWPYPSDFDLSVCLTYQGGSPLKSIQALYGQVREIERKLFRDHGILVAFSLQAPINKPAHLLWRRQGFVGENEPVGAGILAQLSAPVVEAIVTVNEKNNVMPEFLKAIDGEKITEMKRSESGVAEEFIIEVREIRKGAASSEKRTFALLVNALHDVKDIVWSVRPLLFDPVYGEMYGIANRTVEIMVFDYSVSESRQITIVMDCADFIPVQGRGLYRASNNLFTSTCPLGTRIVDRDIQEPVSRQAVLEGRDFLATPLGRYFKGSGFEVKATMSGGKNGRVSVTLEKTTASAFETQAASITAVSDTGYVPAVAPSSETAVVTAQPLAGKLDRATENSI